MTQKTKDILIQSISEFKEMDSRQKTHSINHVQKQLNIHLKYDNKAFTDDYINAGIIFIYMVKRNMVKRNIL